ncbi:MAG: hypothetical protein KAH84_09010 [Thiomargarita sp.]|nr:hypothetical protein [Thiomargarita sp.]
MINYETVQYWEKSLKRLALNEKIIRLRQGLVQHIDDISEVWKPLKNYLNDLQQTAIINQPDREKLQIIANFLNSKISLIEFIHFWQQDDDKNIDLQLNYPILAQRLKQSEIAIFLGSNIADKLTDKLSQFAQYSSFEGSFSEICQYLELKNDCSRATLRSEVENLVQ